MLLRLWGERDETTLQSRRRTDQRPPSQGAQAGAPRQILISARVLMKVEDAVTVEPVGEFELKGIRRPLAAYNVVAARS